MTRIEVVQKIRDVGVIAVVRAASVQEAVQRAEAVKAGGLPILEITMTVPGALQVIEQLARALGAEALVGAGSVLEAETARACIAAGARFIVSPVVNADTISCCRQQDVAVIPGALTPTEILHAWRAGGDLVKVFPVGALGGASYIRSLKAPMPHLELVPTGGVTLATVASFIEAGATAVGAGGDLANLARPEAVTAAARAYVEAVRTARRSHPPERRPEGARPPVERRRRGP